MSKVCLECGGPIPGGKRPTALFCSPAHRKDWNNRRAVRGAELYDLVMSWRYDRADSKDAFVIVGNAARAYRDADNAKRAGRRSWDRSAVKRLPSAYGKDGDGR